MRPRKKEGFPKQRLVVIPANVIERCQALPLVRRLYVTDIGAYPSAPFHYVNRPDGVDEAIMICCLAGKGTLQLFDREFAIHQGCIFFIPPKTPHIYWADEKKPWSLFWIHFGGVESQGVLELLGVSAKNPRLFIIDLHQVKKSFEQVYTCLNYQYSDTGLLAMTAELMRFCYTVKMCQGHMEPKRQSTEKRVVDTIQFMNDHLHLLLTLKGLANHSGQSVSYYSRVFKEKTGQSPLNYFIQLKVSKACQLLDQTDLSVRQIAKELGYDDPYYFSRLFKKIQGVAPAFYRKTTQGKFDYGN